MRERWGNLVLFLVTPSLPHLCIVLFLVAPSLPHLCIVLLLVTPFLSHLCIVLLEGGMEKIKTKLYIDEGEMG
jgi:hypothetical protein